MGNVASVRVMMWADTGEIDSFEPSASLGTPSGEDTSTPSATQGFGAGLAAAVIVAAVAVAVAASVFVLKRRRH